MQDFLLKCPCVSTLYGGDPILSWFSEAWPFSLLALWLTWGPLTLLFATRDGHLRTRQYDKVKWLGYLSDNEWLFGHWLLAPILWSFAVYFGYAITAEVDRMMAVGLLKHGMDVVTGTSAIRWVIPVVAAIIGILAGFVVPFSQAFFTEGRHWRTLNTISFVTFAISRFTVALNYYVIVLTTFDLAYFAWKVDRLFDGRHLMVMAPDGYGGYGALVRIFYVVAAFATIELAYLMLVGYLNPVSLFMPKSEHAQESKKFWSGLSVGAVVWLAATLVLCIIPVTGTQQSLRDYKFRLANLSDSDFAIQLVRDHVSLTKDGKPNGMPVVGLTQVSTRISELRKVVEDFPEPKVQDFAQLPFFGAIVLVIKFFLERAARASTNSSS